VPVSRHAEDTVRILFGSLSLSRGTARAELIDVRAFSAVLAGLTLLLGTTTHRQRLAAEAVAGQPVFRIDILQGNRTTWGTGVLVHEEPRGANSLVCILTAAHIFEWTDDESLRHEQHVRVHVSEARVLEVKSNDVFLPAGAMLDVGVLCAVGPKTGLVPLPLVFEPPPPGSGFVISGYRQDGTQATIPQRVRFASTMFVIGDRIASDLAGCGGAPALVENHVFGIVSDCRVGRTPTIAVLTLARSFIARYVPGLTIRPTTSS
jgi:hypothetical protein